jgi:hypothetical protein
MRINQIITAAYSFGLSFIYGTEIISYWQYLRFEGELNFSNVLMSVAVSVVLSLFVPSSRNARDYIIITMHYFFFVPSVVYATFNEVRIEYVISLFIVFLGVYVISAINFFRISANTFQLSPNASLIVCAVGSSFALAIQVVFGGLENFNLDLESVYEYREISAESMPSIIAYFYSNLANAIIPLIIVISLYRKNVTVLAFGILSGLLLFGMSHHKSVFFTTIFVAVLYLSLDHRQSHLRLALLPFIALMFCAIELALNFNNMATRDALVLNSYFVRRTLLTPAVLDVAYVEFFQENARYLWSSSKLTLGLIDQPYPATAPFMIGEVMFGDPRLSANTGLIGSGYANGGLLGVLAYSIICGALISVINSLGRVLGPEPVAAISIPSILVIVTSTDIVTAFLSHGLVLLLLMMKIIAPMRSGWREAEDAWQGDAGGNSGGAHAQFGKGF